MLNEKQLKSFWSHIEKKESGCWEWTGEKYDGYGRIKYKGIGKWKAHRLSYIVHKGPIDKGLCVCHSCDNSYCVNPEHLWLGTVYDNNRDMVNKNRQAKGEKIYGSKLTTEIVLEFRKQCKDIEDLRRYSRMYNISERSLRRISTGQAWAHLPLGEYRPKQVNNGKA